MENKIGNNIKMELVNSHGIGEFITNVFKLKNRSISTIYKQNGGKLHFIIVLKMLET